MLSKDEMKLALQSLAISTADAEDLFRKLDANDDKMIQLDEWLDRAPPELITRLKKHAQAERWRCVQIRPMRAEDCAAAGACMKKAFGAHSSQGRFSNVSCRFKSAKSAFVAVNEQGEVIGSQFVTDWGSVAFRGPLSVDPEYQGWGVGQMLVEASNRLMAALDAKHHCSFSFPNSSLHGTYAKHGMRPRFLSYLMQAPVCQIAPAADFKLASTEEIEQVVHQCKALSHHVYPNLDPTVEIRSVIRHELGDCIMVRSANELDGFAVYHHGAGTEGGAGRMVVKVGMARDREGFGALLDAVRARATELGVKSVGMGISTAQVVAVDQVFEKGFSTSAVGVNMEGDADINSDPATYNSFWRPDSFIIADLR